MLVYVDTSEVTTGAVDELREAIAELAQFIEVNEPQLLAYGVYLNEEASRMTVVHVHRDSTSLEQHLEVGGPAFARFKDLVTLSSIHVYGDPSERSLAQLQQKARMLGSGEVIVESLEAGFDRLAAPQ